MLLVVLCFIYSYLIYLVLSNPNRYIFCVFTKPFVGIYIIDLSFPLDFSLLIAKNGRETRKRKEKERIRDKRREKELRKGNKKRRKER